MPCPKNGPCPCASYVEPIDLCCLVSGTTFPDLCLTDNNQPVKQDLIDNAIQAATEILWAATGRQFGVCAVKIRPCRKSSACNPCPDGGTIPYGMYGDFGGFDGGYPWYPARTADGGWTNITCACTDSCSCTKLCEVPLPYPVCQINEVKVDGIVLDPSQYRVDDFRRLVRLGGKNVTQTLAGAVGPVGGPLSVGLGPITVTGGAVQAVGNGILVPIGAGPYTFALSPGFTTYRAGLGVEVFVPAGSFGSMDVFGIAGGAWVVEPVFGDIQVNKVGQTIHWSPPQAQNTGGAFRIRMIDEGATNEFIIQNVTGSVAPIVSTLYWTDPAATGCWPECQDLTKPDTEVGTWSVEVAYGRPVPALLKLAAQELACQFIKACMGQPCQLPQRIQSISRQGVTVGFLDPMDFLAGGRTGIYIVDLAINTWNPHKLLKTASVYSSDVGKRWTRVDTGATTTDQCRVPVGSPAPFFG